MQECPSLQKITTCDRYFGNCIHGRQKCKTDVRLSTGWLQNFDAKLNCGIQSDCGSVQLLDHTKNINPSGVLIVWYIKQQSVAFLVAALVPLDGPYWASTSKEIDMLVYNVHGCGQDARVIFLDVLVGFTHRLHEFRFVPFNGVLCAYYFDTKTTLWITNNLWFFSRAQNVLRF